MSEIPEIVALRRDRVFEPYPEATHLVRLDDAERELRSALDRQAREIVEALRERSFPDGIDPDGGSLIVGMDDVEAVVADRSWRRCLLAVRRARRIGRRGICTVPDFPSELVEAAAQAMYARHTSPDILAGVPWPQVDEWTRKHWTGRATVALRTEGCRAPHCWSEYGTPCGTCPVEKPETDT